MRVFHGGYAAVNVIDLAKGRSHLDFGKGFYVTGIRSQAELWAARMSSTFPDRSLKCLSQSIN